MHKIFWPVQIFFCFLKLNISTNFEIIYQNLKLTLKIKPVFYYCFLNILKIKTFIDETDKSCHYL